MNRDESGLHVGVLFVEVCQKVMQVTAGIERWAQVSISRGGRSGLPN
jgi:hypothetical protein